MATIDPTAKPSLDAATAREIALEAYVYLYPLVLMERTRRQMTNVEVPGEVLGRGPADAFVHVREFPTAEFKDVVKPNFDTLYSPAWLDLRTEPRVVTVPATDEYYLLPMYDMWTDIFACPGTRTTGGEAADYAVCGPDWDGELPAGVTPLRAPTPWVWLIGRTKASPATYERVHAFQDGLRIRRLAVWPAPGTPPKGRVDPDVDGKTPPLRQVFDLSAADFFAEAAELMRTNPPHLNDHPALDRMGLLGLDAGRPFDLAAVDPAAREAFEAAAKDGPEKITARQRTLATPVDGWMTMTESLGTWGTNYLKRATAALIGLGVNLPEDAVYPLSYVDDEGQPYDGSHSYVLHFDADALPPAQAFWSLTMYDDEGFQVPNPLNRFAIGDRDELRYAEDGSLDIQIAASEPAEGTANWLPAPSGSFNLCLRLYYPEASVLDGGWRPPGVRRGG